MVTRSPKIYSSQHTKAILGSPMSVTNPFLGTLIKHFHAKLLNAMLAPTIHYAHRAGCQSVLPRFLNEEHTEWKGWNFYKAIQSHV